MEIYKKLDTYTYRLDLAKLNRREAKFKQLLKEYHKAFRKLSKITGQVHELDYEIQGLKEALEL